MQRTLLQKVTLTDEHRFTGKTRHIVGGDLMAPPAGLRIVRYENEAGYRLLYLDAHGVEQTDTWHLTLDDALHQAEFEFSVCAADWTVVQSER